LESARYGTRWCSKRIFWHRQQQKLVIDVYYPTCDFRQKSYLLKISFKISSMVSLVKYNIIVYVEVRLGQGRLYWFNFCCRGKNRKFPKIRSTAVRWQ
jgi:hypothetical protein